MRHLGTRHTALFVFLMLLGINSCERPSSPSDLLPLRSPLHFFFKQDITSQPRKLSLIVYPEYEYNYHDIVARTRIEGTSIEILILGEIEAPFRGYDHPAHPFESNWGALLPGEYQLTFRAQNTSELPQEGGRWRVTVTSDSVTFVQETEGWSRAVGLSYQIVPADLMWGGLVVWFTDPDSTLFSSLKDSLIELGAKTNYYPQKSHFGFTYIGSEFVGPFYSPASEYYIRFRYTGDPDDAIALRDAFLTEHAYPASYDSSILIRPFEVALYFGCGRSG